MTDNAPRRTPPSDPTAERSADPIPDGEDIVNRNGTGRDSTPRRYEEPAEDVALPANDATLNTQI
jgi:hypothetical protein